MKFYEKDDSNFGEMFVFSYYIGSDGKYFRADWQKTLKFFAIFGLLIQKTINCFE